jgi:hypothetical protein
MTNGGSGNIIRGQRMFNIHGSVHRSMIQEK